MPKPPPETDVVLDQLKKLREGTGLTRDRLAASGAVMSALGTSDPDEAYERLCSILGTMDEEAAAVLQVDFGIRLSEHLDAEATPGERRFLGHRRDTYAGVIRRDPKTLARRSNAAIADLRTRLLNDTYTGDLHLIVVVRGGRIVGVTMVQDADAGPEESGMTERRSLEYPNPSKEASLPVFFYAFPRDWRPATLTLTATFLERQGPREVYAFHAPNFIEVAFAEHRYPLELSDRTATARFVAPSRSRVYGIRWTTESR